MKKLRLIALIVLAGAAMTAAHLYTMSRVHEDLVRARFGEDCAD